MGRPQANPIPKTPPIALFLLSLLSFGFPFAGPLWGECEKSKCFDGSIHPCGFDCKAYYYQLHGMGGNTGLGGNGEPAPTGPSPAEIAARKRIDEAYQFIQQGLQYFDNEDWAEAANAFESALEKDPGNVTIQQYLQKAKDKIAWLNDKNKEMGEMKGFGDSATRLKDDVTDSSTGLKDDDTNSGSMKDTESVPAPKLKPKSRFHVGVLENSESVDTRDAEEPVPDMGPDIEKSPAVNEAHKGFKLLAKQDWPSALAWFQTGLQKDPKNPALLRLVDLGKYTIRREKEWKAENASSGTKVNDDIKFLFPADTPRDIPTAEDWKKANTALDQSLTHLINDQLLSMSEKRAVGFLSRGDFAQAKEELRWCVKFAPDQPRYREALKGLEKAAK